MKYFSFRSLLVAIAGLSVFAAPAAALVCGDSEPDAGEQCDDGNTASGDGCSATCLIEAGFDCTAAIAGTSDPLRPPIPSTCGPIGDIDNDGVADAADNCTAVSNAQQRDTDGDGIGNRCDADLDNDCVVTACSGGFNDASCSSPPVDSDMELLKLVFFTSDPDGDFSGDGVVNFFDLQILSSSIGLPPGPSGIPNICDPGVADSDGDGVLDSDDICPDTAIPEGVPTVRLKPNRWALTDGDFDFDTIVKGKGKGPNRSYTVEETAGCSCEQIIESQDLGLGHTYHGCSISAMDDWVELVTP